MLSESSGSIESDDDQDTSAAVISIAGLNKIYDSGFQALTDVHLSINKGEIFALLGPNGAGKTTLISIICGIVTATSGEIRASGYDIQKEYRAARSVIGLVPQELTTDAFETVWSTVNFSRGLFGKPPNPAFIERLLKQLSLWDKKDAKLMALSGGMKRRVMIAKALSHEPEIVFLDEPTAGVDVDLRRGMWDMVRELRERGVTIILTTHYLEEAEEMCDDIAIINHGNVIIRDSTANLLGRLDSKTLVITSTTDCALPDLPAGISGEKYADGRLAFTYQSVKIQADAVLDILRNADITIKDVRTQEPHLEDVFLSLTSSQTGS